MARRVVQYEHVGWCHLTRHYETESSQAEEDERKLRSMLRTCPLLNVLGANSI